MSLVAEDIKVDLSILNYEDEGADGSRLLHILLIFLEGSCFATWSFGFPFLIQ
jgi:hypothetical protein